VTLNECAKWRYYDVMDTEPDADEEVTSNLTIRALPAGVRRKLAARAKARRMSLNAYVVEELTQVADTPSMAEAIAKLDATRRMYGIASEDAAAAVREAREERAAKWD
jgi:plasmid stability protein